MRLGTTGHLPVLHAVGRIAVWPAVAGWAVVFAVMLAEPLVSAVKSRVAQPSPADR